MTTFSSRSGATLWLAVAIFAMMFMGVYALLIALARTPGIGQLFGDQNFFMTALVTHVALALMIWFIAFLLFVMYYLTSDVPSGKADFAAAAGGLGGVIFIVVTPFTGPANPVLSNYVPVLDRGTYFIGLALFMVSAMIATALRARPVIAATIDGKPAPLIVRGSLVLAGLSLISASICFIIAWAGLNADPEMATADPQLYFELLFWGGGHTLQFTHTLALMAVWTILTWRTAAKELVDDRVAAGLLIMTGLFILSAPLSYVVQSYDTPELRDFFSVMKKWGLSFGPIVLGVAILAGRKEMQNDRVARRGLLLSLLLVAMGGAIGVTLTGSDTRVPGHYHGAIGGVTLAFMTLGLVAVSDNGWLLVKEKWRIFQLSLYGIGQSLFVVGLFIGGLRGLPRKTFGAAQTLDDTLKYIGMSVMGIGGLLAVTSGVIFVVFMLKALNKARTVKDGQ